MEKIFCIDCEFLVDALDGIHGITSYQCNNPICYIDSRPNVITGLTLKLRKNNFDCYHLNENYNCEYFKKRHTNHVQ